MPAWSVTATPELAATQSMRVAEPPAELSLPPLALPPEKGGAAPPPPKSEELDSLVSRSRPVRERRPSTSTDEPASVLKTLLLTAAIVVAVIGGYAVFKPKRVTKVVPPVVLAADAAVVVDAAVAVRPVQDASVPDVVFRPRPPAEPDAGAVAPARPTAGQVTISSTPPGAMLYLDDRPIGHAPSVIELSPGPPHTLTATLDGFAETKITIWPKAGGQEVLVVMSARTPQQQQQQPTGRPGEPGTIKVVVNPIGALVHVDGKPVGNAPCARSAA